MGETPAELKYNSDMGSVHFQLKQNISLGLLDVLNLQMVTKWGEEQVGKRFVDEEFGADVTVTAHQFLSKQVKVAKPLFDELRFGFDLD